MPFPCQTAKEDKKSCDPAITYPAMELLVRRGCRVHECTTHSGWEYVLAERRKAVLEHWSAIVSREEMCFLLQEGSISIQQTAS